MVSAAATPLHSTPPERNEKHTHEDALARARIRDKNEAHTLPGNG